MPVAGNSRLETSLLTLLLSSVDFGEQVHSNNKTAKPYDRHDQSGHFVSSDIQRALRRGASKCAIEGIVGAASKMGAIEAEPGRG